MRDPLLERVKASLVRHGLMRPGALVVVAVSGGPDSLALLDLLDRLRADGGPALHVAHLDHGARGAQSAAEAAAVAAVAAGRGLPATVAYRDVPAIARKGREGLPAAARRVRYAFLAEVALATGAHAVAVAHQADDQAETVLMHLLRGAGLAGLRGMREAVGWGEWGGGTGDRRPETGDPGPETEKTLSSPVGPLRPEVSGLRSEVSRLRSPVLLRPLLTTSRAEIEAYCEERGLAPAEDPSNSLPRFARVRVRGMLRALAQENPRVVEALGRAASVAAEEYDFVQGRLDAIWSELAEERPGALVLRRDVWEGLHPSLRRHALRRAAADLGQRELSMEQVAAALAVAERPGRRLRLGPRLWLNAEQLALVLVAAEQQGAPQRIPLQGEHALGAQVAAYNVVPQLPGDEVRLLVPGRVALGGGWSCVVQSEAPPEPSPWWVGLDPAALDGPLTLRRRRPGDRFRPLGGRGSRKLQDFFVDCKAPHSLRDAWPILVTPLSIVWIAGLRADARFAATAQTQSTIWVGITHNPEA